MNSPVILEICVESAASARSAEEGGAHRLELCEHLEVGGTTPSPALIESCLRAVTIPIHVMIRPRGGDYTYNNVEFRVMASEIEVAKKLGAHGVVIGILHSDRTVDVGRMKELVGLARPMSVTFHRAFDDAVRPMESIEEVVRTGAERLLTSGQQPRAENGLPLIARLSSQVTGRLKLVAAAGVGHGNVRRILSEGKVNEIHVATAARKQAGGEVDADLVRSIVADASRV